jgi:hypothetical protein
LLAGSGLLPELDGRGVMRASRSALKTPSVGGAV